MESEQGGNKGAAPLRAGHPGQYKKKEGIDGVKQDIDQMKCAGRRPSSISSAREASERVPVEAPASYECVQSAQDSPPPSGSR
jgi:hypothetical protein